MRNPNLRLKSWLGVPVEVFIVPPAMTKFEIAEYLGKMKRDKNGRKFKLPDFKKAYVYLRGPDGGRPMDVRYQPILEQKTEEALAAWPARPGQGYREIAERFPNPAKKDAKR